MMMSVSSSSPPRAHEVDGDSLKKGKGGRSFLSRFLSTSSRNAPSLTSLDESDSSDHFETLQKPRRLSRKVSVNDVVPTEVEVVYHEDGGSFYSTGSSDYGERSSLRTPVSSQTFSVLAQSCGSYRQALKHLGQNLPDLALRDVDESLESLADDSPLRWKLEALKAEALSRRGDFGESLDLFEQILRKPTDDCSAPEYVSIYFCCGRLSRYLKEYEKALEYHSQELLHLRAIAGNSLDVARIYHDLAHIAQYGLGDWSLAYVYNEQALHIEAAVWQRLKDWAYDDVDDKKRQEALHEAFLQIQETKKSMGRIQFCLGNVSEGLRLSSHRFKIE